MYPPNILILYYTICFCKDKKKRPQKRPKRNSERKESYFLLYPTNTVIGFNRKDRELRRSAHIYRLERRRGGGERKRRKEK
jgi:hypothetical protein